MALVDRYLTITMQVSPCAFCQSLPIINDFVYGPVCYEHAWQVPAIRKQIEQFVREGF